MDWQLPGKDVCAIGGVKESLHLKDMETECRTFIGAADRTAASVELAIRKTCGIQIAELRHFHIDNGPELISAVEKRLKLPALKSVPGDPQTDGLEERDTQMVSDGIKASL